MPYCAKPWFNFEECYSLVEQLKNNQMLPCLIFSDNRKLCEHLALAVSSYYRKKEVIFLRLPENIAKSREHKKNVERYKKLREKMRKIADSKKSAGKRPVVLVEDPEDSELEPPAFPFNLNEYSLRPLTSNTALFDKVIKRYFKKDGQTGATSCFAALLKRGVGVHHSGLTTTQRQSVEILFRAGLLGVVFSTATLALGINMPCRSVVFCFDSMYLTPLQFRQMSGRAGRRGFDKKGNVIFYGIPPQKIVRLLCSNLPALKGNVPFTISFILRLFVLINPDKGQRDKNSIDRLIDQCLVCLKNPLFAENLEAEKKINFIKQLRYYVTFCIQILRLLNLIDNDGCPIGMTGVVSHLHYHEPGNLIFAYFMQRGLFHNLCNMFSGKELMEQMLIVLCTIFTYVQLPYGWEKGKKFSTSKVILEPLPEMFSSAMTEYNKMVQTLFAKTLAASCAQYRNAKYIQLPVSKQKIAINSIDSENDENRKLKKILNSTISSIQNPIAAISGFKDSEITFLNNHFFSPLNETFYFDQSLLPSKAYPILNHRGQVVSLNAYALDFFRHGSRIALCQDNNLIEGDVFHLLKDFMLMLCSISTALNFLADPKEPKDPVVVAFSTLAENYKEKFSKSFNYSE